MKILHAVEFYSPSVGGMQEVVKQLSERMISDGHKVCIVTSFLPERTFSELNGVKLKEFKIKGNGAIGLIGEVDEYRKFLKESNFDIVTFFAAQQWTTDAALAILDEIDGKKIFVPTGFSGLLNPLFKDYFNSMTIYMKKFDMNVFLSDDYRDINFARINAISKTILIPNAASETEFNQVIDKDFRKKHNILVGQFIILHVGSFTRLKGHVEAIEIFLNLKDDNSVLLLAGNDLSYFRNNLFSILPLRVYLKMLLNSDKRIIIADLNREETISAFNNADLFLFPSNIECSPLVLFEAAASGTPFLASDCGNSSEIAQWLQSGMIMPTIIDKKGMSHVKIRESAELLDKLLLDKEKLVQLKTAGLNAWKEKFTWSKIANKYINLYQSLLKEKK